MTVSDGFAFFGNEINDVAFAGPGFTVLQSLRIGGSVVVVGYPELFDKFTADTGIKYEMLSMSSGAVLSKLQAEGANPTFDVWFGGDINDFINVCNSYCQTD